MTRLLALVSALLVSSPVAAQHIEVAPFTLAGYTTSASIDTEARGVDKLAIESGFAWAAQAGYFFSHRFGVEGFWRHQPSGMSLDSGSSRVTLFYMQTQDLDFNAVYQFAGSRPGLVPFVSGGLGMTFLSSDALPQETKFAWNAGVGLKWFFMPRIGVRVDGRYRATRLNTSDSDYCALFALCQGSLKTFQLGIGAELRLPWLDAGR